MKKLFGVTTAMTTPFDANGNVMTEALKAHTEFLVERGVNCLYPCGSTGEMYSMSVAQRKTVAETVVRAAAKRVTVFIHTGAMNLEDTVELSQHAHEIGADGVGIVTPSYFTCTEKGIVQYYCKISSALPEDFPIYIYVIPQLSRNDISPETMDAIASKCPNIIGVKYSFPDMQRLQKYQRVNSGKFSVVFGADDLFLPALIMGADGVVSGCSSPFPEPFVNVYKKYTEGDLEGARQAQYDASTLVWLMKAGADMSIFKNLLKLRGIDEGIMHSPLPDLSKEETEQLKKIFAKYLEMYK